MTSFNFDARKFQRDLDDRLREIAEEQLAGTQREVEAVWDRLVRECSGKSPLVAREQVRLAFDSVGIRFESITELEEWTRSIVAGHGINARVKIRWA